MKLPFSASEFFALLWLRRPAPLSLLVIPLAWSAIGTTAALQLDVSEDLGLVVAGIASVVLQVAQRVQRAPRWSGAA